MNRRNFLRVLLWVGLIGYSSKSAFARLDATHSEAKSLSFYNPRTKESFNGIYWNDGKYDTNALKNIDHIMRDIRTGDIRQIDPVLLDLIHNISLKLNAKEPFHVFSGFRSRKTNDILRNRNKSVAKNSYHLKGQAADIRLPGTKTSELRRTACELKKGGVGFYPRQRFVHIDVGPVRYWKV